MQSVSNLLAGLAAVASCSGNNDSFVVPVLGMSHMMSRWCMMGKYGSVLSLRKEETVEA